MWHYERFDALRKAQGKTKKYMADLVGRKDYYIRDLKGAGDPPIEYVQTWADDLGTTPAYLLGKTDQKEKPADLSVNGLSAEQQRIIDLWSAASPEIRAAARAVLETGVPGALAPDAQEAQQ